MTEGDGHHIKLYGKSSLAPAGCRNGMGIEKCTDCLLPDCNEWDGKNYQRDTGIRADKKAGMTVRALSEKWGICISAIEIITREG